MKKIFFKLLVLCCLFAGTAYGQVVDGPYVFYRGRQVIVKSVVRSGDDYVAVRDSFGIAVKAKKMLPVQVDGHPEWDFTVQLKKQINNEPMNSAGAANVLVLSDIEGEFEPFRNLLLANHVIDEQYRWTFGKGQLMVAGDLFDRGKQVSQYLWLLYKLEDEAKASGGYVHVILGNHDIMNLGGDFRYVQPAYMANAKFMQEEYKNLYGPDTELGHWLRSKNVMEKDGDFLVLHGGVSPDFLAQHFSLEEINELARPFYDRWIGAKNNTVSLLFGGTTSPFWYRGFFMEPKAAEAVIDSTLAFYDCKKIIVGHDIIDHVAMLYGGKVIGVDVNEHEQAHEALLIENDKYYRVNDQGVRTELQIK